MRTLLDNSQELTRRSEMSPMSDVTLVQEPELLRLSLGLELLSLQLGPYPKHFSSPPPLTRNLSTISDRSASSDGVNGRFDKVLFSLMLVAISARLPCSRIWLTISPTSESEAERMVATMTSSESFFSFSCSMSRFNAPLRR